MINLRGDVKRLHASPQVRDTHEVLIRRNTIHRVERNSPQQYQLSKNQQMTKRESQMSIYTISAIEKIEIIGHNTLELMVIFAGVANRELAVIELPLRTNIRSLLLKVQRRIPRFVLKSDFEFEIGSVRWTDFHGSFSQPVAWGQTGIGSD